MIEIHRLNHGGHSVHNSSASGLDAVQLCFRRWKEDPTPFNSKLLTHLDINKD